VSNKGKFLQRYPLDVLVSLGAAAEIDYGKNRKRDIMVRGVCPDRKIPIIV